MHYNIKVTLTNTEETAIWKHLPCYEACSSPCQEGEGNPPPGGKPRLPSHHPRSFLRLLTSIGRSVPASLQYVSRYMADFWHHWMYLRYFIILSLHYCENVKFQHDYDLQQISCLPATGWTVDMWTLFSLPCAAQLVTSCLDHYLTIASSILIENLQYTVIWLIIV